MSRSKWIVEAKFETREELEKLYKEMGADLEEQGIEDFNEVEISIIREDNELGKKSYGWDGDDKITLFDEPEETTEESMKWYKKVAETMCEALNRKGL